MGEAAQKKERVLIASTVSDWLMLSRGVIENQDWFLPVVNLPANFTGPMAGAQGMAARARFFNRLIDGRHLPRHGRIIPPPKCRFQITHRPFLVFCPSVVSARFSRSPRASYCADGQQTDDASGGIGPAPALKSIFRVSGFSREPVVSACTRTAAPPGELPGEYHLRALLEPCLNLSIHTAPDVQPTTSPTSLALPLSIGSSLNWLADDRG